MPAEESIARTERSGKDFLTSAVTVPRPQPSSRTVEEELGGESELPGWGVRSQQWHDCR